MEKYVGFITQDIRSGVTIIFICLILICSVCMLDLWTGIDAARANRERICSRPLRKTGTKIVDYFRLLLFKLGVQLLDEAVEIHASRHVGKFRASGEIGHGPQSRHGMARRLEGHLQPRFCLRDDLPQPFGIVRLRSHQHLPQHGKRRGIRGGKGRIVLNEIPQMGIVFLPDGGIQGNGISGNLQYLPHPADRK